MDTQKLHDLIDKVIGKSGPLRTPAWWMRKVLNDVVGKITELEAWVDDTILKVVYNTMLKLETRLDVSIANCIKSIPKYTYAELKALKDKELLIPGQTYETTFNTKGQISDTPDGLDGSYKVDYGNEMPIYITACSSKNFATDAIVRYADRQYNVKYSFERNTSFAWCKKRGEVASFIAKLDDGEHMTFIVHEYLADDKIIQYKAISSDEVYCPIGYNSVLNEGNIINATKNGANIQGVITSISDIFKGFVYEWYDPFYNIRSPYPPDSSLKVTFSIERVNLEPYEIVNQLPLSPKYSYWRNVTIGQYVSNGVYYLPRICMRYISAIKDSTTYIGNNCTLVYIDKYFDGVHDRTIHIGDNCNNVCVLKADGSIRLHDGQDHITLINCIAKFIGASERVTIVGCGKQLAKHAPIISHVGDVYMDLRKGSTECYSKVFLMPNYYLRDGETVREIILGENNAFDNCMVGVDSNGNIRCWNPADYVDAIEPEEQTTETTEE